MHSLLNKYDGDVRQVALVEQLSGSRAHLVLYVRNSSWTPVLDVPAVIGREGLGKLREGDMKTPCGDFGIVTAFGIKPDPGTSLPYVRVDDGLWCCGEQGDEYNRFVHHPCEGEHLIEYTPQYDYGLFLDYNREGVWPLGSAIFIHVRGPKSYTAGCVAVAEEDMVRLLQNLEPGVRVLII